MIKRGIGLITDLLGKSTVVRDGLATLVIKIASAALAYLMFVIVANVLSAEEYGRFGFGIALAIALGNIAALGTATSNLRFIPQYMSSGQQSLAKGYFTATSKAVAASTTLFAIGIAIAGAVTQYFYPGNSVVHIYATAALVLIIPLCDYISAVLRSLGNVMLSQVPKDVVWRIAVSVISLICLWMAWPQTGASMLMVCTWTLLAICIWQIMMSRSVLATLTNAAETRFDKAAWVRTMLPIWGISSLVVLVQQFDVVILGLLGKMSESGPYFAAARTASMLSLLLLAGNLAAAPLMSSLYHNKDMDGLKRMVRLASAGIGIPTLLGLGFLALIGGWMLTLFGSTFDAAYPILMVLACGYACDAAAGPTAYLLQMTGHEKTYLKILAVSYAVVVVLQVICIPIYGLMGAAVPATLGMLFTSILAVRATKKYLGIDPSIFGLLK